MKSRKSVFSALKWLFSLAFAALAFMACEIGLGDAVDTLPPEVSISGPSTNSILRDEFVISGVCSDDTGVKTVTVELKNTELNKTYDVISVTPDKNNWQVSLNKALESGKYPYADGKYDVTVHAYDFQGKDSGPRNISIVIDNTAPLMVLTRPSSGDKYGQKFDITGQVADDSNIDLVEVYVYSKETDVLLKTIQLKNVPPTIDLSAAVFGDESYSEIYGTNKEEGDKEYYCEIKAYDAARKYPEEAGDKGNEASFFYMYDDIYDLMQGYKLTELHHIQNGLFARSAESDGAEVLRQLNIPAGEEGSIQTKRNMFVLNPLNNPTYELSGYAPVESFSELENNNNYKIKNEGKLTIKINAGRDNTPLVEDTIKIYAKRVTGKTANEWIFADEEEGNPATVLLYPFDGNTIVTNGLNREITIDMSLKYGLVFGETYVFDVKGNDKDLNGIFNNGIDYGFYYKSSDKAPQLTLTEPSATVYIKADGKMKVKGNVYHEEGKSDVNVEIVKYQTQEDIERDGKADAVLIPITDLKAADNSNTKYTFDCDIDSEKFVKNSELNKSCQYTMSISATLGENTSSPIERTVIYDVVKPEITVSSVSPVADTSGLEGGKEYNVNGKITIRLSVNDEDAGIKRAFYRCNKEEISFTKYQNYSISFDTATLPDKHDFDFEIVAEDKAGNITEYTLVYDDGDNLTENPKYFVDQSTDKPLIQIEESQIKQVTEYTPGGFLTTLSKKHTLTGKITDDDGLDKYVISLYEVDSETGAVSENLVEDFGNEEELNGIQEKMISKQMPNENNIYKLVITAKDKKKVAGETPVESTWFSFVKVAGDAPFVSVTSGNKSTISTTGIKNKLNLGGRFSGAHTPGTNAENHLKIYLLKKEDSKKTKADWCEVFDAASINYGTDAVTKDWSCSVDVNSLPITAEGEQTLIIRIVDGNGRSTDDEISYTIDDTKPSKPSVDQISEKITSSSYQFKTTTSDNHEGSGVSGIFYQISDTEKNAASAADLTVVNGWTEVSGNESFSFYQTFVGADSVSIPAGQLKEGVYTLYMYAVDNAGNISARAEKEIIADFTLPEIKDTFYVGKPETDKLVPQGTIIVRKPTEAEVAADETLSTGFFTLSGTVTDTLKVSEVILRAEKGENVKSIRLSDNKNAEGEDSSLNPLVTKTETKWDWSINLPFAFFEDGTWTFNYKVYDQSGRFAEQNTALLVDTTAPVLLNDGKIKIEDNDYKPYGWSKKTKFPIEALYMEAENASGLEKVNCWVNTSPDSISENPNETYYDAKQQSDKNEYKLVKTITDFPDGENYLHLQAIDKAGNASEVKHFRIGVDTKEPVVTIDQTEIRSNGKDKIIVSGTITDTNKEGETEKASGLNTWVVLRVFKGDVPLYNDWKDGNTNEEKVNHPENEIAFIYALNGTEDESDNSKGAEPFNYNYVNSAKFKITLDPEDVKVGLNSDGEYTLNFVALDQPENRGKTPVKVYVDTVPPTIEIKTISSLISANGKENNVNGKLTLSGNASDKDKVQTTQLKIYKKSEYDQNPRGSTVDIENLISSPENSTEINWTYTIDTAKLDDTTEYVLVIESTDRTGNVGEKEQIIYVNQATDKPEIVAVNAETVASASELNVTETNKNGKNIFGTTSNNVFRATITDDDGIDVTKLTLQYSSDEINWTTVPSDDYSFANSNLTWTLPSQEGKYLVVISAEDNKKETTSVAGTPYKNSYRTWVGVSAGAPTITVVTPQGQYRNGKDESSAKEMKITGNWHGESGTTVTRTVSGTNVILKYATEENAGTEAPVLDADNTWSDKVYAYTEENAEVTVTYTVTDMFNQKGTAIYSYTLDNTAPSFSEVSPASPKTTIGSEDSIQNWYNTTAVNYSVTVTDEDGSGISNVQYKKNSEETWNDMTPSATQGVYTGTIILSDQGQNTIYFRAVDVAGNYSSDSSVSSVIYIDTKLPEEITLSKIDGEPYSGRKLANGQKNISFVAAIKDTTALSGASAGNDASGISNVKLLFDGVESAGATVTSSGSSYTITVPKDLISASGKTMVQVGVRVTDKVENSYDKNLFSLNIDTTPPSDIKISELMDADPDPESAGYTVNKTFKVSGTANDDQSLEKVELQYKFDDSDWKTYKTESGDSVIGSYTWSAEIDSTSDEFDGNTFKIRLKATDSAGNISYGPVKENGTEDYPEIIVNQDSDIPVITVDGMKADGRAFISQRKITGSVEDDDGNIDFANFKISKDGTNWNSVTPLGTSRWSYELSSDGSYTLYFKVIDAAGNEFSNSSSQEIVIKGDDNIASTTGTLVFTVDTLYPDVSADLYKGETKLETQADRKYSAVVDINAILKITAEDANGLKEIGAYIGTRAEDDSNVDKKTDNLESGTEYELNIPLPDDDDLQAATVLTYYAEDKSGHVSSQTYTITVDNVAPSLTVSLPSSTTSIAGDTTVKGTTSDGTGGSGVSSVRWFIPTNQQVEAWAVTGEGAMTDAAKDALFTNTINGTYSWAIEFNADKAGKLQAFYSSTTAGGTTTWHNYPAGGDSSATYGTKVDGSSALYDLPIYFRIEDNVGNVAYHTSYTVRVNPDGDRPVATILYPTLKEDPTTHVMGPDTLSGSIRINGDASDEVDEVKEVRIQIQKSKDNTNTTTTEWEDVTGYSYVLATGTYKWNYSFDSSESVFNPVGAGATATHLRFRVWAIDEKENIGDKSEWTVIRTDKDNPLIGKTNKLRIVKYKNDTASTSASDILSTLEYEEGMFVSGTVFLEFSVEDASGLKEITAGVGTNSIIQSMDFVPKNGEPVTSLVKDSEGSHTNQPAVSEGYYGYDKVRVKLVTTGSGNLNFTVRAVENTDNNYSSTRDIKLRYDNTAPTPESLKHGGDEVGLGAGKVTVKQSDGKYSLKSVINENDSGLAQMFMFWTRTKSGEGNENKKRVYDPRKSENNVFYGYTDTGITQTIDFNSDGLPYRRYTSSAGLSSSTTSSFTLSAADPFLTVANYVLIDGTYRKITNIEGTKYTFAPASEAAPTTVDAIYAIAIDNDRTELSDLSSGDDGDGIWESLVDAGATYEWEMNFNSHNIPDGPVTISCLAIDTAGNKSELQETETKIENNAPRMTKVFLGTDLNHNSKFEANEYSLYTWFTEHTSGTYSYGDPKQKKEVITNGFKVKKDLSIVPEFVGGVGDIYMVVNTSATNTNETTKTTKADGSDNLISAEVVTSDADFDDLTSGEKSVDESNKQYGTSGSKFNSTFRKYNITNADLVGGVPSSSTEGTGKKVSFTFWDSTEELEPGSTTQSAVLYIPDFEYDMIDDVKPTVIVKPFKWVSKDDNSLYNNSTANGHIELEDDLSGGTWTGYTEGAPKVSGKIVFRGTAYDNVGLTKLKFAFGSSTNATAWINNNITATYANGSWSYTANGGTMTGNSPDGWTLTVKDVIQSTDKNFISSDAYFGQDGHKVAWEFALDTEKWTNSGTNPAAIGAKLTVTAEDNSTDNDGSFNSSSTVDSTAAQEGTLTGVALDRVKNKSVYVVDVVPYITGVTTRLTTSIKNATDASIYNRTAKGHYPVNCEKVSTNAVDAITLSGFNLGTTTTVDPTTLSSGAYTHTVNEVSSINNLNNNNAKGQAPDSVSVTADTVNYDILRTYAYNRKPNNSNNNTLTDDVIFDVWQFNSNAAQTYEGNTALREPVVRMNPSNGTLGYIFGSGSSRFSMPNKAGGTNGTTYQLYQFNYATYVNMALCYDETGVAHGISTGIDTYVESGNQKAGRMSYFNSTWGPSKTDGVSGNFNGNNAVRFDCIGIPRNSSAGDTGFGIATGADPILEEYRFYSPSIVATRRSENKANGDKQYQRKDGNNKDCTTVYFAYYDKLSNQIRFRAGDVTGDSFNPDSKTGQSFGQFYHNSNGEPAFLDDHFSVIAGTGSKQTTYNGGKYICIDVIPGTSHDEDIVVAVWQDSVTDKLIFAYNDAPYDKVSYTWKNDTTDYGWKGLKEISSDSGYYCQIKADDGGNVHIACVNGSDEVEYTYIPKASSGDDIYVNPVTVIVDSKESSVKKLSLDVETKDGKVIPYITYFATKGKPKMAYFDGGLPATKSTETIKGADVNGFTGKWESGFLPTVSKIADDDSRNNTSVCASKVVPTTANFYVTGATDKAVGQTGNKTTNPVVGYAVSPNGTAGRIEIAQKK